MQNPPPQQPGYGSSYGAPPPQPPQKSGLGIEPNLAAALSYLWIVGLIFFFIEKENRFIRFHALQSVLYGVLWMVVMIALVIINFIIAIGAGVASSAAGDAGFVVGMIVWLITILVWMVIPVVYIGVLILAAVKAYQGKTFKLPIIGKIAENIVNK
jgi:uncharacterized membrane protein